MSKAANTLLLLTWIFDTYSTTMTERVKRKNRFLCRLIAGNIIAGNY